ncbi:signal peptidase I [Nocardioides marinquilinus]|uniref:signal peptidase I n=1 Tax=Nocardioides marinquilinus TaxID=1210400 RepID=UPI0031F108F4
MRTSAVLVLLAGLALLATVVVVPRLAGATPYTVLTGSMRPDLGPGTLVVVRPVDPGTVAVGDVVTYQLESGEADVVTHRVVEVQHRVNGTLWFVTQGDANPVADAEPVRPEQLRGEVWYSVPHVGRLHDLLGAQSRAALTLLAVVMLSGYAVTMFAGAARDRRDRRDGGHRAAEPRRRATAGRP